MIIDNSDLLRQLNDVKISLSEISKKEIIFNPFWDDFKMRFCWSSNALEGNTLSLDETVDAVKYDEVRSGHTFSEYAEAKNLYRAIDTYMSCKRTEITPEWIKKCNTAIMGTNSDYRMDDVYVGTIAEAVYYPPHYTDIPELMDKLLSGPGINNNDVESKLKSIAEFHISFERIHPFMDGNGRTGRMIMNQQLINCDLFPISIDKTSKYRQAFRAYDRNCDISLLVHLICNAEIDAVKRIEDLKRSYEKSRTVKDRNR